MQFTINHSVKDFFNTEDFLHIEMCLFQLIGFLLLIGLIHCELRNVCDICICDHMDKPLMVHCDGKNLSTLTDIMFNSTIEILSLSNNNLTLKSGKMKL